jgi:pyruvate dehydrogenase E1 component
VVRAASILERYEASADVWSVTSYQGLRRDALRCECKSRLRPEAPEQKSFLEDALAGVAGPFIATSCHMKLHSDQIARWVPGRFVPLGTDGFGISDTRTALRRHFEIDAEFVAVAALDALHNDGKLAASEVSKALRELGINVDKLDAAAISSLAEVVPTSQSGVSRGPHAGLIIGMPQLEHVGQSGGRH